MDLEEKFKINYDFLSAINTLHYESIYNSVNNNENINKLKAKGNSIEVMKESSFLSDIKNEYDFFKNLHIQGKYDNIISLIKIGNRLNINLNFEIDIENPDYDLMWNKINEQIPIPNKLIEFLEEYNSFYVNDVLELDIDKWIPYDYENLEKYILGDNDEDN